MDEVPGWLIGVLNKRSLLALRILAELIEAGLRNGEVSANDNTQVYDKSEANTVGAVFKILPKFGFTNSGRRVKTTAKRKHSRRVDLYYMTDSIKAKRFKHFLQEAIVTRATATQQEMGI